MSKPVNLGLRSVFSLDSWVQRWGIGKAALQSAVWHRAAASTNNQGILLSRHGFRIMTQQIVEWWRMIRLFLQKEDDLKFHLHFQNMFFSNMANNIFNKVCSLHVIYAYDKNHKKDKYHIHRWYTCVMPSTELIFQPKHRLIWFPPRLHMTLTPDTWLLTAVTAVPCGEGKRLTAVCHLNFTIMADLFSVPLKVMKYWTRVLD